MPDSNTKCKNPTCNKDYYVCVSCKKIYSWKASCCSIECFQEMMRYIIENELTE